MVARVGELATLTDRLIIPAIFGELITRRRVPVPGTGWRIRLVGDVYPNESRPLFVSEEGAVPWRFTNPRDSLC